jgi:hypothetical protein
VTEQVPDGLTVKIHADRDAGGRRIDYVPGSVVTLSRNVALNLIARGVASLSDECEPGQMADLLAWLKRSPSNLVELAFAIRADLDPTEALLKDLVRQGRISATSGRRYQRVYFLAVGAS